MATRLIPDPSARAQPRPGVQSTALPPKSSCIGCPFHSNAAWRRIRDQDLDAWDDAVAIDRAIRTGLHWILGEVYLHRSAVPLDEADLSIEADHGRLDRWPNECEGMCGV
jgi:hypothetical protein